MTEQSVVLLCDGRWPDVPGVCCWRHGVRTAFAAAGATVTEVCFESYRPLDKVASPTRGVSEGPPRSEIAAGTARVAWLSPALRRPLARADRAHRAWRADA